MNTDEIDAVLAERGVPVAERRPMTEELFAPQDGVWHLEIEEDTVLYRRTRGFEAQVKLSLDAFRDGRANRNKVALMLQKAATRDACPECGIPVEPDPGRQEGTAKRRVERAVCVICGIRLTRGASERWRRE
jgi:hypothetical protein